MVASTPSQSDIIRMLNYYCFRNIWNQTEAEYRQTVVLYSLQKRYATGRVTVGSIQVALPGPAGSQYQVYTTPWSSFNGGIPIAPNVWVNTRDLLDQTNTYIHAYSVNGQVMHRDQVYILHMPDTNRLLVAISKQILLKTVGAGVAPQLYLSLVRDDDQKDLITTWSYSVLASDPSNSPQQVRGQVANCLATNAAGTTLLINGLEQDPNASYSLNDGDLVELILDAGVKWQFFTQITPSTIGYISGIDQRYKLVAHNPKVNNPNNNLITHDLCTFWLRNTTTGSGVYFHQVYPKAVGQITHNDMSIDQVVTSAFQNFLQSPDVTLRVQVRQHPNPISLVDESSFIGDLYQNDDDTIVNFLTGNGDPTLPFWTAAQLERSGYVTYLFDAPNSLAPTLLKKYSENLGYYEVADILAGNIQTVAMGSVRYARFVKPFMMRGMAIHPLVYLRGIKVPNSLLTVTDSLCGNIVVGLDSSIVINPGDSLTAVLFESQSATPHRVSISANNPTVTMLTQDYDIYQEVTQATPSQGWQRSVTTTYQKVAPSASTYTVYPSTSGNGYDYVFSPSMYGKTYLIQPNAYVSEVSLSLDSYTKVSAPIVVPISIQADDGTVVPMLSAQTIEAYINGKQLILGLDFTATPVYAADGSMALCDLVISNAHYLAGTSGNVLEIVVHAGYTAGEDVGYVVENVAVRTNRPSLWYPDLTRLFVAGKLVTNVGDKGTWLSIGDAVDNGSPFNAKTVVPASAYQVLLGADETTERQKLIAVDTYMKRTVPTPPPTVIIPQEYKLYSPYLAAIAYDVANGTFTIVNDPDDTKFLMQFGSYAYLRARDATLTYPSVYLDTRFVDVAADYANFVVGNPYLLSLMQRLIKLTLAADNVTIGDNLT